MNEDTIYEKKGVDLLGEFLLTNISKVIYGFENNFGKVRKIIQFKEKDVIENGRNCDPKFMVAAGERMLSYIYEKTSANPEKVLSFNKGKNDKVIKCYLKKYNIKILFSRKEFPAI